MPEKKSIATESDAGKELPDGSIQNPSLYREMSKPFPTADAADDAIRDFIRDVRIAREKNKIQDVYIVLSVIVATEDGEQNAILSSHHGDANKAESMAAWAAGYESAKRSSTINSLRARGERQGSQR